MPRGRRRKFKIRFKVRPDTARSIIALILILLAFISLLSFFTTNYSVNAKINSFIKKFLGAGGIILPFIFGSAGILFIDKLKLKFKEIRIIIGLLISMFSVSGLFHLFVKENPYEAAVEGRGGGLLGYKTASILINNLSKFGAFAVLIVFLLIAIFLVFNLSFTKIFKIFNKDEKTSFLKGFIQKFKKFKGDEDKIEVISGTIPSEDKKKDSEKYDKEDSEDMEEPIFEVIPTMSEPESRTGVGVGGTSGVSSTVGLPQLPSDRIWEYPPLSLLKDPPAEVKDTTNAQKQAKIIARTLESFNIDVEIVDIKPGASVTQYSLKTRSVTKISKIASLHEDLALALASPTGSVRIEAPIPGKSLIGIEVPNDDRSTVYFKSLITSDSIKYLKSKLGIVLGKDVGGKVYAYDIAEMPHLLIAGATGSGKSVFIHNLIFSLLYRSTPQEVKLILIDPKRVELIHYKGIPHLLTPVVTDMDRAPSVFRWAVEETEKRYKLLEQAKVRNIEAYNDKSGIQVMPYIMIIVDELGEIMVRDPAGVEKSIIRIAQMARAVGIHLIMAVQRPSTDVITGLIKANIPCRVAFNVMSQVDSRVIIDQPGAEKLLGKGDMLFVPPDVMKPTRLQGAYVTDTEINDLVDFLKGQGVEPEYKEEVLETPADGRLGSSSDWGEDIDELYDDALDIIISADKASASLLQRKLSIGYTRAARIIDSMEDMNFVGPDEGGSRGRQVYISNIESARLGIDNAASSDSGDEKTPTLVDGE